MTTPVHSGAPYTWPRADRTTRKAHRRQARLRRQAVRQQARIRRNRTWRGEDSLPVFAARLGLPVWGTVTVAVGLSLLIGSLLGLTVVVVQAI